MDKLYNVGEHIIVKDPSGQFSVEGEVAHIVTFPPIIPGMNPVILYYVKSFNESENVNTDSEVPFAYYDVIDSDSDSIITDESELERLTNDCSFE